jgi:tetratricopeptide (TPR) repeat protein
MHGNVPDALPHFHNALGFNPNDVNSNMGLAIYDLQSRNFPEAIRYYQLVVKQPFIRKSILQQAYLGLAKSYNALGDHEDSRESLRRAKMAGIP